MKVVITGGAGFIGSNGTRRWVGQDPEDEVVVIDALTYAGRKESLADLEGRPHFSFLKADPLSPGVLRQVPGRNFVAPAPEPRTRGSLPVLFSDVGGVVVEDHWAAVARELARDFPIDERNTREILTELCPRFDLGEEPLEGFFHRVALRLDAPIPWETFREVSTERALRLIRPTYTLYRQLRSRLGVRVYALSNMSEEIWRILEDRFRISLAFDGWVLSSHYHVKKPEPRFFEHALAVAREPASACIFVDDLEANVRGARRAGLCSFRVSGDAGELRQLLAGFYPGVESLELSE